MSVESNVQTMREWFDAVWTRGDFDFIPKVMAPNGKGYGQSDREEVITGPAEFTAFARRIRGAFPDMKTNIEDVFGVDDRVVVRWTATMTHDGDDLGIAATHKAVKTSGISIARFADGKIVEGWDC